MIKISFSVSKIVPAVPKLQQVQRINATEKVSYYKGSIFALLRLFVRYSNFLVLIRLLNATHAKITYLCNRFGLLCSIIIPTFGNTYQNRLFNAEFT